MRTITAMSRKAATELVMEPNTPIISIRGKTGEKAVFSQTQRVLYLQFDDVTNDADPGLIPFSGFHARAILKFVLKYTRDDEHLIVHCEAGISRSAAVADALDALEIAEWKSKDNKAYVVGEGWQSAYHPNPLVKSVIMRVWGAEHASTRIGSWGSYKF